MLDLFLNHRVSFRDCIIPREFKINNLVIPWIVVNYLKNCPFIFPIELLIVVCCCSNIVTYNTHVCMVSVFCVHFRLNRNMKLFASFCSQTYNENNCNYNQSMHCTHQTVFDQFTIIVRWYYIKDPKPYYADKCNFPTYLCDLITRNFMSSSCTL